MQLFQFVNHTKKRLIMCVFSLKKYFSFLANVIDWIMSSMNIDWIMSSMNI